MKHIARRMLAKITNPTAYITDAHAAILRFEQLSPGTDRIRISDASVWRKAAGAVWYQLGPRGNMTGKGRMFAHYEMREITPEDIL